MTAPNEEVGEAVVKIRPCQWTARSVPPCADSTSPQLRRAMACPNCQGNGTWLDTTEATAVERCEVWEYYGDVEVVAAQEGDLWRAVEKGDSE